MNPFCFGSTFECSLDSGSVVLPGIVRNADDEGNVRTFDTELPVVRIVASADKDEA